MRAVVEVNDFYYLIKKEDGTYKLKVRDGVFTTSVFSNDIKIAKVHANISEVELPNTLIHIQEKTFEEYTSLKSIHIPSGVQSINKFAFKDCLSLEKVTGLENVKSIEYLAFYKCNNLRYISLENSKLEDIEHNAFFNSGLESIEFPETLKSIEGSAFFNSKNLKSIKFRGGVSIINALAFNCCDNLSTISTMGPIKYTGLKSLFTSNNFYLAVKNGELVLSNDFIDPCGANYYKHCDFKNIDGIDVGKVLSSKNMFTDVQTLEEINQKLKNGKVNIHFKFLQNLGHDNFLDFAKNSNMKFFKKVAAYNDFIEEVGEVNIKNFYLFASMIGCFSPDEKLNQRANVWLTEMIERKKLEPYHMKENIKNFQFKGECKEFANFLFPENHGENMHKCEDILENHGILTLYKIYEEFSKEENEEQTLIRDEKGNLKFKVFIRTKRADGSEISRVKIHKPTVQLFTTLFAKKKFENIDKYQDVAVELSRWNGMEQTHFNIAKNIINTFEGKQMNNHILGLPLYKKNFSFNEKFSWEFLSKDDPKNLILGLYCDCCANISDSGHGIMELNYTDPDTQNLVIKDKNNVIVAKATLHINRDNGYGMYNTIEIANRVRGNDMAQIYTQFIEATNAFVDVYNKTNSKKITKMVVGNCSLNDLLDPLMKNHRLIDPLDGVPTEYEGTHVLFGGESKQFVLWEDNEGCEYEF